MLEFVTRIGWHRYKVTAGGSDWPDLIDIMSEESDEE